MIDRIEKCIFVIIFGDSRLEFITTKSGRFSEFDAKKRFYLKLKFSIKKLKKLC